jgi:protein-S-isoprenylcysteine O-methyltransferase Ste14
MWKHLRAIILLPSILTLVIPGTILCLAGTDSFGFWQSIPASRIVLPMIGGLCICLGLLLMVATIRLFVKVGRGTLAPWEPTQRLVVQGVYRHVRNPMISGVLFVLLGESVLTASLPLFRWFLVFAFVNAIYIPQFEVPGLVVGFGDVPKLQAERAEMGSQVDAVGQWVGRCHMNAGTQSVRRSHPSHSGQTELEVAPRS